MGYDFISIFSPSSKNNLRRNSAATTMNNNINLGNTGHSSYIIIS